MELTRTLSHELSPPLLQGEDLADLLEWIAERKRSQHDMDVQLDVRGAVQVPDPALRILLYQFVRELLFNVLKHAGTRSAFVMAEEADALIRIAVIDEGAGFDPETMDEPQGNGFGLQSVRERLKLVGGQLAIVSAPGEGTQVTLTVPAGFKTA